MVTLVRAAGLKLREFYTHDKSSQGPFQTEECEENWKLSERVEIKPPFQMIQINMTLA
jgi:hypothetical protein